MKIIAGWLVLLACLSSSFAQTQLIVNGGFETPIAGEWVVSGSGVVQKSNGNVAHGGLSFLEFGGVASPAQNPAVYQSVFLPTNTVAAALSYFYDVYSQIPGTDDSAFYVQLYTNNHLAVTIDVKSSSDSVGNGPASNLYSQRIFDLTAYKGLTNQIVFSATLGTFGSGSFFEVDDVTVLVETTADIPSNDFFTNRVTLTGTNATGYATNTFATRETGEPNHASNIGGKSVWWIWIAPKDGVLQLDTGNSTFGPLLAVYTGDSISNLTRVASVNGAQANDNIARLKLPVRAGVEYQIAVDGPNNGGGADFGTVVLNLKFQPDITAPKVVISTPASNAKTTNSTLTVTGTASDNVAVSAVLYRLENSAGATPFQTAIGTNKWTATLNDLVPGPNTIRVFGLDTGSNVSVAIARTFNFVVVRPLNLSITGIGTLSPNYSNSLLEVGKSYTITAKPGKGQVFSNWVGDITSSNPKLTFVMQSNLTLQANFIPNPFIPVKGAFAGLIQGTNGVTPTNTGYFSASVTDKGTFSARIVLPAISASTSGKFALDGSFSNAIARPGKSPIRYYGQLDLSGGDTLTATFTDGLQTAELIAHRQVWSKTNPAPEAGKKFTLVIPGIEDSAAGPGGFGFGTATVDVLGNVSFSGTLADGTKVSQRTFISKEGLWPFFSSPYSGKGCIIGWLGFATNDSPITISGTVSWLKLARPGKYYPQGFDFEDSVQVSGSTYSFTNGIALLSSTNAEIVLQGGNLFQSITNPLSIGPKYKVTGSNALSLTFTTTSGLFRGTVLNPATNKKISVSGVLLQSQDVGYGLFAGTNQTGSVLLLPQSNDAPN